MLDFLTNSLFFGVAVSLAAYEVGSLLKKKFKSPLLNPLLISIILVIAILVALDVDYQSYNISAKYLSYLLTPATVCLAIPLYEQIEKLKSNWKAIVAGIVSGIISCVLCVYAFSLIFGLTHEQYVTLLPKSITTAIGMDVSTELGGITTITVAVIIITGVFGNIIANLQAVSYHRACRKGCRNGFLCPRNRNSQGYGDGRSRRCNQQFVYRCNRSFNCYCRFHCRKSILNYLPKKK